MKDFQLLCLITWHYPYCLGIPKINQLETAANHNNCSACLPDLENRETKALFYCCSWPKQKHSSPVPNARLRRSDHPQIKDAYFLDKTVENFPVLSCQRTLYFFSNICRCVRGAKGITRIHGCCWGDKKLSPGLKWLSGDHDCLPEIRSPEQKSSVCLSLGVLPQGEKGTTARKPWILRVCGFCFFCLIGRFPDLQMFVT